MLHTYSLSYVCLHVLNNEWQKSLPGYSTHVTHIFFVIYVFACAEQWIAEVSPTLFYPCYTHILCHICVCMRWTMNSRSLSQAILPMLHTYSLSYMCFMRWTMNSRSLSQAIIPMLHTYPLSYNYVFACAEQRIAEVSPKLIYPCYTHILCHRCVCMGWTMNFHTYVWTMNQPWVL